MYTCANTQTALKHIHAYAEPPYINERDLREGGQNLYSMNVH